MAVDDARGATVTPLPVGPTLERVKVGATRHRQAVELETAERELRDRAIVDALEQGLQVDDVARAAGLSRTRVFGILSAAG